MVKWISVFLLVVSGVVMAEELTMSDPTAPPKTTTRVTQKVIAKAVTLPTLKAIFIRTQEPGAVLENKFVAVGASVRGYRLVKLATDTVTLSKNGQLFRVKLDNDSVKTER